MAEGRRKYTVVTIDGDCIETDTQGYITRSTRVLTTMSKGYSESLVQDLNNELAECLRREWDIVGQRDRHIPSQ